MKGGKRKLSEWNIFVKKVYNEGKSKNANYEFKQALADASKRKSEMGRAHGLKTTSKRKSKRSKSRSRRTRRKY